jgi:hypothetical protein
MSEGYIKLYRQIRNCELWVDNEPFDRRSAWIDLLLMVNHADRKVVFESQLITVKKGQTLTSIMKLSERWKWNRKKTKKFLSLLESAEMVTTNVTTHGTTITVINWDKYQLIGTTDGTTNGTTGGTTEGQPRPINNNDKECIKNDKKTIGRFTPPDVSEVRSYCIERNNNVDPEAFVDFYQSKGWMVGKNKMKDWKAALRIWERNTKKAPKPSGFNNFEQKSSNFDEIRLKKRQELIKKLADMKKT